jgi:ankyrin repeat protein
MFGGGSYPRYRFTKGTKVLCRTGANEWSAGVIVALDYSEPDWPPGRVVPYQVSLNDGRLIFVPADVDQVCRKFVPPWWDGVFKKSKSLYAEHNPKADSLAKAAVGKDVNVKDHEGSTALMEAVRKSWANGVSQLITLKADVNIAENDNTCAIHLASAQGEKEIVKLLVEAKADLNQQDSDPDHDPEFTSTTFGDRLEHRTPLHYTCFNGDSETATVLLEAKACIDVQDAQWKTPLHLAIEEDQEQCIDLLLRFGANTNLGNQCSGMDNSPLMDAASAGKTEIVKKLITAQADINKQGKQQMSALHLAARSRRVQAAETLLAARADMHQESACGSALQLARKNGGADLLAVFGAQPDSSAASNKSLACLDKAQIAALFLD